VAGRLVKAAVDQAVVEGRTQAGSVGVGRSALGKGTSPVLVVDRWVQRESHL
jgi:hypothetical protein